MSKEIFVQTQEAMELDLNKLKTEHAEKLTKLEADLAKALRCQVVCRHPGLCRVARCSRYGEEELKSDGTRRTARAGWAAYARGESFYNGRDAEGGEGGGNTTPRYYQHAGRTPSHPLIRARRHRPIRLDNC